MVKITKKNEIDNDKDNNIENKKEKNQPISNNNNEEKESGKHEEDKEIIIAINENNNNDISIEKLNYVFVEWFNIDQKWLSVFLSQKNNQDTTIANPIQYEEEITSNELLIRFVT